jgi:hypothetical protein
MAHIVLGLIEGLRGRVLYAAKATALPIIGIAVRY